MPLLVRFMVVALKMKAPAVRVAKQIKTNKDEIITVFDIRLYRPNKAKMTAKGLHTLEQLFAGFIRDHLNSKNVEIIDCSPMGCRTGFYMSVLGNPNEKQVAKAVAKAMKDVLKVKKKSQIPELNVYQCGSYKMHSLKQAKKTASYVVTNGVGIMDNKKLFLSKKKMKKLGI